MHRRAFTLIELLVVIAIIAILAAILFPVFAQAKAAAKGAAAISNVKQMGTAFHLYLIDSDDVLPLAAYGTEAGFVLWHDILDPYVKNKDVWHCPGSTVSKTDANGTITSHWGYNVRYLTDFAMDFSNANSHHAVGMSSVEAPSETLLLTSAKSSVKGSWCGDDGKLLLPPSGVSADCWGQSDAPVLETAALDWIDSHAGRKRLTAFYTGQSPVDRYFDLL